jgi:hypothetical protein
MIPGWPLVFTFGGGGGGLKGLGEEPYHTTARKPGSL